jgi:hypothetical protein
VEGEERTGENCEKMVEKEKQPAAREKEGALKKWGEECDGGVEGRRMWQNEKWMGETGK